MNLKDYRGARDLPTGRIELQVNDWSRVDITDKLGFDLSEKNLTNRKEITVRVEKSTGKYALLTLFTADLTFTSRLEIENALTIGDVLVIPAFDIKISY